MLIIWFFFSFWMETNECFENLLCCKIQSFFLSLFFQTDDVFINFVVVFLHRFIKAKDGLVDFFFKISEKSLHNGNHLSFGFSYFLLQLLLFFDFYSLMFFHIDHLVAKLLYILFEKSIQVSHYFMNTILEKEFTFRTGHKFFRTYVHQCVFWCRWGREEAGIQDFCKSWRWVLWGERRNAWAYRFVQPSK